MAALARFPAAALFRAPGARDVLRAMSQTGAAALASGALSLLATKIIAVVAGPASVALLATLQQLRTTALLGASLNGQTALVQGASAAQTTGERGEYLRTVGLLMSAATALSAAALVFGGRPIALYAGLDTAQAALIRWLALPLVLSAMYIFATATLNARGEIAALARLQLVAPLAMLLLAYPAARGGPGWLVALLTVSSAAALAAAAFVLYRRRAVLQTWLGGGSRWWSFPAARRFFAISGALAASGLFASWALVAVRARILDTQGLDAGGQFDAAWAISMNQTTLVLASLQTYYLPTLSRATEPEDRSRHIGRVLTIAAATSAALIAVLAAAKPWVVELLYSDAFEDTARYLRWTLAGDYLKVSSWILSIPLVAAADMRSFLTADVLAYGAFAGGAAVLARYTSAAEAAAMAFVLMYAVHLLFCAMRLWQRRIFRPGRPTAAIWLGGLALVTGVSGMFWNP